MAEAMNASDTFAATQSDGLTEFVDRLSVPTFPTLEDFDKNSIRNTLA